MKAYIKPTIEFIELKPEERLACVSGGSGCCGGTSGGGSYFWPWVCGHTYPWGSICRTKRFHSFMGCK